MKELKIGATELLSKFKEGDKEGVSKTQLNYWIRSGAVDPFKDVTGSGARRVFNFRNIVEVAICKQLNKFGLSPLTMKAALDYLRAKCVIIHEEGQVHFTNNESAVKALEEVGNSVFTYWEFFKGYPDYRTFMTIFIADDKGFSVEIHSLEGVMNFVRHIPVDNLLIINLSSMTRRMR
jgi:DNA-binding transcriptional MerR regulator